MRKEYFESFKAVTESDRFLNLDSNHQNLIFRLVNEYNEKKPLISNYIKILLMCNCTEDDIEYLCIEGILQKHGNKIRLVFLP